MSGKHFDQGVPWFGGASVRWLDKYLTKDMRVFEWGSGASTGWFADRCKSLVSVEHTEGYFKAVQEKIEDKDNVLLLLKNENAEDYYNCINDVVGLIDVIIVDGAEGSEYTGRVTCIERAVEKHTGSGIIVVDDWQRARYDKGKALLDELGYTYKLFQNKPIIAKNWQTQRITAIYSKDKALFSRIIVDA